MGMTTPLVVEIVKNTLARLGKTIGMYYGINIVGAAIGSLISGFFLIELLGLTGSVRLAGGLNIFSAFCMLFFSRTQLASHNKTTQIQSDVPPSCPLPETVQVRHSIRNIWILLAFFCFGLASVSFQMFFFRIISQHYGMISPIFSLVLFCFLVYMALGQYLGGVLGDAKMSLVASLGALFVGLLCTILFIQSDFLLNIDANFETLVLSSTQDTRYDLFFQWVTKSLLFLGIFMLPVVFSSSFFSFAVKRCMSSLEKAGYDFGMFYSLTTVGNIVASVLVPLYLFESIGTINVLRFSLVALAVGSLALLIALRETYRIVWHSRVSIALPFLCTMFVILFVNSSLITNSKDVESIIESRQGIISVFKEHDGIRRINISGVPLVWIYTKEQRNFSFMKSINDLGLDSNELNILIIGLGHAQYLPELVNNDRVKSITIVELSATWIDMAPRYMIPKAIEALKSPKVSIVVDDGRHFVERCVRDNRRYHLVQIGALNTWTSGSNNLYSTDFMEKVKSISDVMLSYNRCAIENNAMSVFKYSIPSKHFQAYFNDEAMKNNAMQKNIDVSSRFCLSNYETSTDDNLRFEFWFIDYLRFLQTSQPYFFPLTYQQIEKFCEETNASTARLP